MVVVDLGYGPGATLVAVAGQCPDAVLVGVDLNHAALQAAASTLRGRYLMVCADATRRLPLADECVDVIVWPSTAIGRRPIWHDRAMARHPDGGA